MLCVARQESLFHTVLQTLAFLGEVSQPEMFSHVHPHGQASARLVRYFANASVPDVKCSGLSLDELAFGAQLHDVGKYLLKKSVILKPGKLSEEEYAAVSLHPIYGVNILSQFGGMTDPIRRIVLHHHEHWDGSGYPDGLSGMSIPLEARTVAVVDVYTSLRARRSYKETMTKAEALSVMREMAGQKLDPCLTEDFIKLVSSKPCAATN
jgi:HD-GYP domain-containing protein (c-di-GMP phosphodiesterase class II)